MNKNLWNKILEFDPDAPVSEYGFSTRLANENYWTKQFTATAILEYKRFMYLAATSDFMVSPSGIIDSVWHLHLIFTQSYSDFCNLIGKQIQHVPSTHSAGELVKFQRAKERTRKLYNTTFGEQPKETWEYDDMYASLELPKARLKIRTFIILGIITFALLMIPFYFLLRAVYVQIDNPYFVLGFIAVTIVTFGFLENYNRRYLASTFQRFSEDNFIYHLKPLELVYLKTQKLSNVIHGTINQLVEEGVIAVHDNFTLEHTLKLKVKNIEEHQVLDTLHKSGNVHYSTLLHQLMTKPIFGNVPNCLNAFKKYFTKSKAFGKLFYINFVIAGILLLAGLTRYATGLLRDKPVTQIFMLNIALSLLIIGYLWRLANLFCTQTIPAFYRQKFSTARQENNGWEMQYFLSGNAALAVSFIPLVEYFERRNSNLGSSCTSSCGSSCGSSCSSCGGCGGGD